MLRGVAVVVVVVVASLTGAGVVSANENEMPVAAAGLDQQVTQGSTVYLDAGGSFDPDGDITNYEWEITAPNGTTRSPICGSCAQTHFRANQSGEYAVTVTVTDDDGATASDTLYVDAVNLEPPSVSVTGPTTAQNGSTMSIDATVTPGDSELDTLVWSLNGSVLNRESLSGARAERSLSTSLEATGPRTVRVRAVDVTGASDADTHTVYSQRGTASDGASTDTSGSDGTGGSMDGSPRSPNINRFGDDGAYRMWLDDGAFRGGSSSDVDLSEEEVERLAKNDGVEITEAYRLTDKEQAIVIENPRLKEAIDKDTGKLGQGFSSELRYATSNRGYEYKPKWRQTDPGVNWVKDGEREIDTHTKKDPVDKAGWKLDRKYTAATGDTYAAYNSRNQIDEQIGYRTRSSTQWKDSPTGGEVIDTRKSFSHYSWTETTTDVERVKVGEKVVGQREIYGFKTETVTKEGCGKKMTILGNTFCVDGFSYSYTITNREWGVVDTEPITEPQYEWQTTLDTVTKTSTSYPVGQSDVTAHYETEYEIKTTTQVPLWLKHERRYQYTEYEYRWVYDS